MAFDYSNARNEALAIISEYGASGQAIKKGATGGYNDEGDETPDEPDEPDVIIDGIITPLLQYKTREIDGTNIIMGDSYVFFHSDIEPEINMQITLNSKTFRIVDTYKLSSVDDINVFRKLQLR